MKRFFLIISIILSLLQSVVFAASPALDNDDFGEESLAPTRKVKIKDPLSPVNIGLIYAFLKLDKFVIRPISIPYKILTTEDLRFGITNVFTNVQRGINLPNSVLTFSSDKLMANFGYFTTNVLMGIGGLSDISKEFLLDEQRVKSSDVFRFYGVPEGFYFMVIIEPATIPDILGIAVDTILTGKIISVGLWADGIMTAVNARAQNGPTLDIVSRIDATTLYESLKTSKYSIARNWTLKRNIYQPEKSTLKNRLQEARGAEFLL